MRQGNQTPWLKGLVSAGACEVSGGGLQCFDFGDSTIRIVGFGCPQLKIAGTTLQPDNPSFGDELLRCWQVRGYEFLDSLAGDFALVAWCKAKQQTLVSADRFSTHAIYWAQDSGRVAFATSPTEVDALLDRRGAISSQSIYAYLYFHTIPAPLSICAGVNRLDIGQGLKIERGQALLVRHWEPTFEEHRPFSFADEKARFFDGLKAGVAGAISGHEADQVGCFLSGGTDSSTLAGILTEVGERPARTFSIVFEQEKFDERRYSQCAAKHFGTDHTEHLLLPEETEQVIHTIAASYEQPFGNASAVPTYVCARKARDQGVHHLLGGDGGDELFGGNTRYARTWMLSHYSKLPISLRQAMLEPLLLTGALSKQSMWALRKLRGYVSQAREPLPDQFDSRFNLLNLLGPENILTSAFCSEVATHSGPNSPIGLQRDVWSRADPEAALINQLLAYDFKFTLGDSDLPKVTRMCHAAGVSVAFPMLADEMVSLAAQLPANQKLHRTRLRRFFRDSLKGYLPDLILEKSKHGFGMPFGDWLQTQPNLNKLAFDALDSLVARGMVRASFVLNIRARLETGHASYYGTIIWVLMMLELWLRESPFADERWS
ncbi:MAG: asparagine synthetase B [Burkholderiaceae bacterium]